MSRADRCWVALLSAWAAASPARLRAQSGPDIVIEHADRVIPANGGLLVLVPTVSHIGAGAMAVPARVEVNDSDKTIPGETQEIGWVEDLAALSLGGTSVVGVGLVWTPEEPLVPGASYTVRASLTAGDVLSASFRAGEAWEPERPDLVLEATLQALDLGDDETHCCSRFVDGSGHEGCFVARYAERPVLAPSLTSDAPEEQLQQFVYMYRAFAEAASETIWSSGFRTYDSPLPFVPFLTPVESYCVEVQARHIVTQATHSYSRCVPAAQLSEPLRDPADEIAAALRIERCSVPQYGDLLQWCELNADTCAETGNPDCELYDTLCEATLTDALDLLLEMEDERERRAAEATLDAGAGADAAPADAAVAGDAGRAQGGGGGGCSCDAVPGYAGGGAVGAGLWLLCAVRWQRRRAAGRLRRPRATTP